MSIALRHAAFAAGQAPTTGDARHSEGNYRSYVEDLRRRKGPDAAQAYPITYGKPVRA